MSLQGSAGRAAAVALALVLGLVLAVASAASDGAEDAQQEWRQQVLQQSSAFEVNATSAATGAGDAPAGSLHARKSQQPHKRHGKQYLVSDNGGGDSSDMSIKAGFSSGAQAESGGLPNSARPPAPSPPAAPAASSPSLPPHASLPPPQASPAATAPALGASPLLKEKFNYASFDCGAIILATNAGAKHATSILIENKDHYMLNDCAAAEKFLVVELCEDILVENVLLANLEFFSSTFHRFQVSVSDRYPPKLDVGWRMLGEFHARNLRELQTFRVPNPVLWARYLRIDFLTHYGSQHYCPVSLLRVNGKRMMEEFQEEEDKVLQLQQQHQQQHLELAATDANITLPANLDVAYHPGFNATSNWDTFFAEMMSEKGDAKANSSATADPGAATPNVTLPVPASGPGADAALDLSGDAATGTVAAGSEGRPSPAPASAGTGASLATPGAADMDAAVASPPPPPPEIEQPGGPVPIAPISIPPSINSQESVFKTILKRLSALELNSTLTLMYMEMQNRRVTESVVDLDKLQKDRIRDSHRKMENWSRSRWNTLKSQHDTIITNLVQEVDRFERQIQQSIDSLERRLDAASTEIIFYNRVYITLLLVIIVTFYVYMQTGRGRRGVRDGPTVRARQSHGHVAPVGPPPSRGQSQEEIRLFAGYDEIEDDADVVTMGREVMGKRANELGSPIQSPVRSPRASILASSGSGQCRSHQQLQQQQQQQQQHDAHRKSHITMQVHSLNLARIPALTRQISQPLQSATSSTGGGGSNGGGQQRKKTNGNNGKKKRKKTQDALSFDGIRKPLPGQPHSAGRGGASGETVFAGDVRPLSAPPSQMDLLRHDS